MFPPRHDLGGIDVVDGVGDADGDGVGSHNVLINSILLVLGMMLMLMFC